MKRVVSIILLVSVLVIFASCGSKKQNRFSARGAEKQLQTVLDMRLKIRMEISGVIVTIAIARL